MTETITKVVHAFRIGIYLSLFITLIFLSIRSYIPYRPITEIEDSDEGGSEFWPPDMIPHPHPPQPAPKDDNWG